jgi:phospholipase A1
MIAVSGLFQSFSEKNTSHGLNCTSRSAACLVLLSALTSFSGPAAAAAPDRMESCLLEQLRQPGSDNLRVGELRQRCQDRLTRESSELPHSAAPQPPAATVREERPRFSRFFEPYKESYMLTGVMRNKDGGEPFSGETADIKFRLGMKFKLFPDQPAFENLAPLYIGYSQESWWDIAESSGPFREHNYSPEVFWDYSKTSNRNGLNFVGRFIDQVGYEHQSNGEDGLESRSWDRLYLQRQIQLSDRFALGIRAWNVVEDETTNDDITDYLGNIRLNASYRVNDRLTVRLNTMKGWETSKISYQLDLVYQVPEWVNSQFMLTYYEGYGEALISYNQKTSSLRAGLFFPISFEGF